MNRFVFLTAEEAQIVVLVESKIVGASGTPQGLAHIFDEHGIDSQRDSIYCSSTVDFCTEEGFCNHGDAHALIDAALGLTNVSVEATL